MSKVKALLFQNAKLTMTVLSGMCVVAIALYILSVNFTVRNIVKRQAMETQLSHITSKIGELEFQYIHQKNSITLDYAVKLGFVPTTDTKYVSRKTTVAMADVTSSGFSGVR